MYYSIKSLKALLPFTLSDSDREDLEIAIKELEKTTHRSPLDKDGILFWNDVRGVYYWTYGGMRFESEVDYAHNAIENHDFMKWHNIHLIYPQYLPDHFTLHIKVDEDEELDIAIKLNFLTMPYIAYDDPENG